MDQADILSPSTEAMLTERLKLLEQDTGVQLVVATTNTLNGQDIAHYSLDLANAWGVGNAERNDGLVVLVAPHERKVRIEVGLGLEATVSNEEAAAILRESVLPQFRAGDYDSGVTGAVEALEKEVAPLEMKAAA